MISAKIKSVLLLSGGLDSTVAATSACQTGEAVLALTFDYKQRAAEREIEAAAAIARQLGIKHKVIELPWLAEVSRSALTDRSQKLPHGTDHSGEECAAAVWVPNRNALFIHAGAAVAEGIGADRVVAGFNLDEAQHFPDNSGDFLERINRTLLVSTKRQIRAVSPTVYLTKTEIVGLGLELDAPLGLIWSCYDNGPKMCGLCTSCAGTIAALRRKHCLDFVRERIVEHRLPIP
jgi:7-cyano-7-deazaguanine synthase